MKKRGKIIGITLLIVWLVFSAIAIYELRLQSVVVSTQHA
jgi:hypothetical protein